MNERGLIPGPEELAAWRARVKPWKDGEHRRTKRRHTDARETYVLDTAQYLSRCGQNFWPTKWGAIMSTEGHQP